MLISTHKRFIVLSPTKVASTSVSYLVGPFCDIRIGTPAFGKHWQLSLIRQRFDWIFNEAPLEEFKIFLLLRAPLERAVSLYASHLKPAFDGQPTSTKGMSVETFVSQWLRAHAWMSLPQFLHGMLPERGFVVDYILRSDKLETDLPAALSLVGVTPKIANLGHANVSPVVPDREIVREELGAKISDLYADDQYLFDNYTGRMIDAQDKDAISQWLSQRYDGETDKDVIQKRIVEKMAHLP